MEAENIEWIFVGGIDNILLKIIDPPFLGLTIANSCEIASKSIRKTDLSSKEWVFANVDSHPSIIDPKIFQKKNNQNIPRKISWHICFR